MSEVLAIIPARSGSKGIPNKNFRSLAGLSPMNRAIRVCHETRRMVPLDFWVSSDIDWGANERFGNEEPAYRIGHWLYAPAPLHTDTCPMIDVIQDVLARVPGPPEQIIVLVQPTQPLRQPKHLTAAISLLEGSQADSVVSVVEVPRQYHGDWQYGIAAGQLYQAWDTDRRGDNPPATRQELDPQYVRDGTVYAFWRKTVALFGTIYGQSCYPLVMDPAETCPLDTLEDWAEAERRLLVPA